MIRCSTLLIIAVWVLNVSSLAQEPLVKFYPVGTPQYCKGCGPLGEDYWNVTIRLENVSGSDLILYGQKLGDKFYALSGFQRRNPNTCEWEYGSGETIRRVPWNEMPDHERIPQLFSAGEVIDSEGSFGSFEGQTAKRYTAFVSRSRDVPPTEIFSSPFEAVFASTPDRATFRLVDNVCSPQCKIGIRESPKIGGIQLGMSIEEFRTLYSKVKIHTLGKRPDIYRTAYIWTWTSDAYRINVTFINDKIGSIESQFKSLEKARDREDFWERISLTIRMPYFWKPFQSEWKCSDFVVHVVPNVNPTITIQTPGYIKFRDRINAKAFRRK